MRFSSISWVITLLDIVNRFSSAYNDSGVPHSDNFSAASIRGPFSPPGSVSRLTTLSICLDDGVEPRFRKSNIRAFLWLFPHLDQRERINPGALNAHAPMQMRTGHAAGCAR